jgi:hypothetical protein
MGEPAPATPELADAGRSRVDQEQDKPLRPDQPSIRPHSFFQ